MGFGFKLEEYFSEGVLNLPFLMPFAVGLAIVICIAEIVLGITLLLGLWKKLTVWSLLVMIVFFTFLTFYSWYFNKVTDCGCFGDAIPLDPGQSFVKDLILTALILILFAGQKHIQRILPEKAGIGIVGLAVVFCAWMSNHVLNHLPMADFRAYKIGTDIEEGLKTAEELGLQGPVYETMFTLQNVGDKELVTLSDKEYIDQKWWEKKEWVLLDSLTETKVIEEGYEPPIHDFTLDLDTGSITEWVLHEPAVVLVLAYDLTRADAEGLDAVAKWGWEMDESSIPVVGWTSSLYETIEETKHNHQIPFEFAIGDGTAIKTVVRSNPGIVALVDGVIVGKWHWNDLPSRESLEALLK